MHTKSICLLLLVWLTACSGGPASNDEKPAEPLKASKLYENQVVKKYVESVAFSSNLDVANEYLAKGQEAQKANDPKALFYYKRALTYMPSVKGYTLLGKYLLYKKQYEECMDAAWTSIDIFRPSDVEPYGDYLVAQVMAGRFLQVYAYTDAIKQGAFTAADLATYLEKKWPVVYKKKRNIIRPFINSLGSGNVDDEGEEEYEDITENVPLFFLKFWNEIPPLQEPFAVSENDLENFDYYGSNDEEGYYFDKFYPECQAADPPYLRTNLIAKLPDSSRYRAVIYKVDSSALGSRKKIRMIYYRLCTYTAAGSIIDHKVVAAQLGERFETCTLQNGVFTINTSKRKWSKPFTGRDFDNDLLSTEYVGSARYTISPEGKITEAL